MKLRLIMPLLVIVAAFLFTDEVAGQTNGTFNNLTVRNQARIMGTTYIDTALYLRGLKPHIVAMNSQWVLLLDSVTENIYKIKLSALADSVPLPAQYWTFVDAATDTLKNSVATGEIILLNAITNVPNRFTAYTNNTYLGYDAIGESVRQLGMWSGGGYAADSSAYLTVTHSDALSTVTGSAWNSFNSATISAQADSSSIGIVNITAADKYFNLSGIAVSSENITIAAEEYAEMSGKTVAVLGDSAASIASQNGGYLTCWDDWLTLYTNFYLSVSAADSVSIVSPTVTFSDDVEVRGTLTSDNTFAELFEDSPTVKATVAIYRTIVSLQPGDYNEAVLGDSSITVNQAGIYMVQYHAAFTHSVNNTVCHMSLFVDDVEDTNLECEEKIGTGGDFSSIAGSCLVSLAANDVLKIKATSDNAGNMTINHFNFNVVRIK